MSHARQGWDAVSAPECTQQRACSVFAREGGMSDTRNVSSGYGDCIYQEGLQKYY